MSRYRTLGGRIQNRRTALFGLRTDARPSSHGHVALFSNIGSSLYFCHVWFPRVVADTPPKEQMPAVCFCSIIPVGDAMTRSCIGAVGQVDCFATVLDAGCAASASAVSSKETGAKADAHGRVRTFRFPHNKQERAINKEVPPISRMHQKTADALAITKSARLKRTPVGSERPSPRVGVRTARLPTSKSLSTKTKGGQAGGSVSKGFGGAGWMRARIDFARERGCGGADGAGWSGGSGGRGGGDDGDQHASKQATLRHPTCAASTRPLMHPAAVPDTGRSTMSKKRRDGGGGSGAVEFAKVICGFVHTRTRLRCLRGGPSPPTHREHLLTPV